MNIRIYQSAEELKGFSIKNCPSMPLPGAALMCEPTHYGVFEDRDSDTAARAGNVDPEKALVQWKGVKAALEKLGCPVKTIGLVRGFDGMVFASNQTFTGLTCKMERVCMLSHMRHPARRGEVAHFEKWFKEEDYRVVRLKDDIMSFEGTGDCLWHPGKRLLWGAYGFRTDAEVFPEIAQAFEAPVVLLKLVNERFYHLHNCFCPLTQEAVLVYPPAFAPESLELILKLFPIVLAADEREAAVKLACNAAIVDSTAIIQKGAPTAARQIKAIGLDVVEVETSEFIKSGASSFSLKMQLF